jgi:arabinogalactan endo-1,4-beta-galactosidase
MKRTSFIIGTFLLGSFFVAGQGVVLYRETFPYGGITGSFPVSEVAWADDIPDNPNRLYQNAGGDGAVYAYQSTSTTTAFYTSTALAAGAVGAAFPGINPAVYSGITFLLDIQPYYNPANVSARFAVQMNGGSWYAAATALPVPATTGPYVTCSNVFSPSAAKWKTLSVSGNGTGTTATIGSTASSDLTGNITGAGVVFNHTGSGTFNFDNFLITATNPGSLAASSASNATVTLSWPGALNVRLQGKTNLSGGSWSDLSGTGGQNATSLPVTSTAAFFRSATFPMGTLSDGDFESGNLSAYWQTSGNAAAASVLSGGAYSGSFYLQQSNTAAYQVETWQLVTNLPNGYYKLTAMVKNSGGQTVCYLRGNDKMTSLPVSSQWTNTIVRGINVTNGQCRVSLYSTAPAGGNWCRVDFIQLIKDDIPYHFLKGGDISELTYVEQGGGKYYETNGVQMDCLQILKNHGFNIARLRLYNDPGNTNFAPSNRLPPGIQSPTNILDLAARAKAKGMQIQLTFYYSDYWTNGKPHDWVGLSFPQLTNAVYNFTTNFMTRMKNQGTTPEYVSLGNEINGGILLPDGSSANFSQLAQLLNVGYAAVKAVSPSTQVILHLNTVSSGAVTWFFNLCVANGVNWDIIGCSYYPFWTGLTSQQARDQINSWYATYNKPVLIMETGYNWATNRCDGYTGQLANNGPEPFPSTPLGQKQFLLNCFNSLKLVDGGHCIGDLYWDPIFIHVPGQGWELGQPNVVDNTTLFDCTGHALPVLDAFNYNN